MKINTNSWHWKVFLKWERRKRRTAYYYERPKTLDLCRYFRTVMIYAPLRWFFQREGRVKPAAVFMALGFLAYLSIVGVMLAREHGWAFSLIPFAGTLAFLGLLFGADFLLELYGNLRERRAAKGEGKREPSLVWEYVKARKRKVCPILEIED